MSEGTLAVVEPDTTLVTFQAPEGKEVAVGADGRVQQVDVSSIVSVFSFGFVFQENANTPGRFLEQTAEVNRPPNTGFFVVLFGIRAAFTTPDFQFVSERPLGQVYAQVGLRDPNIFVAQARLTANAQDAPIQIIVSGNLIFFN